MESKAPPRTHVVIYEDDLELAREIMIALVPRGFGVHIAHAEEAVFDVIDSLKGCVLILDRMIFNKDSIDLVERLRAPGNNTAVLIVSSLSAVDERVKGLKSGGDDYLTKPFSMEELVARVHSLARRAANSVPTSLVVADMRMDLISRKVRRGTRVLTLTQREFALLEYMMRHSNQVVTREMILEHVWNIRAQISTNVVDVHIGSLRKKIELPGETALIKSSRGKGFVFGDQSEPV